MIVLDARDVIGALCSWLSFADRSARLRTHSRVWGGDRRNGNVPGSGCMTNFFGLGDPGCFLWRTYICTYIVRGMNTTPTPQSLLQQIARLDRLERGTLSVLREGAHGPCCNFQRWEGGRNVSQYVPAAQVPLVRENLEAYAQFAALIEQYVQLVSTRSREARLAGVKKKRLPPTSSSPKKPRSRRS